MGVAASAAARLDLPFNACLGGVELAFDDDSARDLNPDSKGTGIEAAFDVADTVSEVAALMLPSRGAGSTNFGAETAWRS